MKNRDLQATWAYHNATKHSYQSIRTNPHYLDWDNQPLPFKIYSKLAPIPLPEHLSSSEMAALTATERAKSSAPKAFTEEELNKFLDSVSNSDGQKPKSKRK